jgi:hypothetical protein
VLAADLRAERGFVLPRATLCLGRLESRDFLPLTEERKAAVQAFCVEHLSDNGKAPELHIDGTGLLSGTGGMSQRHAKRIDQLKVEGGRTMNGTNLLSGWVGIAESVALMAIVVLAMFLMVGVVKLGDVLRHLVAIFGVTILLIMLPAIMGSLWSSMTFWQHLGIVILGCLAELLLWKMPSAKKGPRKRRPSD